MSFVERSHWLSTFTAADTSDALDSRIREFELSGDVPESAFKILRRVSDSLGIREVVCAAREVAFADGRMQPTEEVAFGLIQSAIQPPLTTRQD